MVYILFDIGGTKTRIGVSFDGKRLGKVRVIPTPKTARKGIKIILDAAQELAAGEKIKAVAGGIAGSFDRRKSIIVGGGANIKGWMGVYLKEKFEKVFRVPTYLENDAALVMSPNMRLSMRARIEKVGMIRGSALIFQATA